ITHQTGSAVTYENEEDDCRINLRSTLVLIGGCSRSLLQRQRRRADQTDVLAQICRCDDQVIPVSGIERILPYRLPQRIEQEIARSLGHAAADDDDLRVENVQKGDDSQADDLPGTLD